MDVSGAIPHAESLIPPQFQFGNVTWMERELDGAYPNRLAEFVATEKEKLLNYIMDLGRPEPIARIWQLMDSTEFVKRSFQELGILAMELEQFEKDLEDLISLTAELSTKLDEIKGNQRKCWFRQQFKYWSNKKEQNARFAEFQELLSRAERLSGNMWNMWMFAKRIWAETNKFWRIEMKLQELHVDHLPMLAGYFSLGIVTGTVKPFLDALMIAFENYTASLKNWECIKISWCIWRNLDNLRRCKLIAILNIPLLHEMARIRGPGAREIWFLLFLYCGGLGLYQNFYLDKRVRKFYLDPRNYSPGCPVLATEGDIDLAIGKSVTFSWCVSYSLHSFISLFYIL